MSHAPANPSTAISSNSVDSYNLWSGSSSSAGSSASISAESTSSVYPSSTPSTSLSTITPSSPTQIPPSPSLSTTGPSLTSSPASSIVNKSSDNPTSTSHTVSVTSQSVPSGSAQIASDSSTTSRTNYMSTSIAATSRSRETNSSVSALGEASSSDPSPSNVNAATRGSTSSSNTAKIVGGTVVTSVILLLFIFGLLWYRRTRRRRAARESVWFSPQAGSAMTSGLLNRPASNGSSFFYTAQGEPDDIMSANNHVSPTYRYGATSQALVASTLLVVPPSQSSDETCTADSDPFADPTQHVLKQPAIVVPVEVPMDHALLPITVQDPALFLGASGLLAWEVPLHSARNSIMVPGHEDAIRTSLLSDRSGEVQSVEAL